MRRAFGWGLIVALAACLPACEQRDAENDDGQPATTQPAGDEVSLESVKRKTQDAAEAAFEYARQKKQEYQKRIEPELDKLAKRAEELKKRMDEVAKAARPEVTRRLEKLRERVGEAREKLRKLAEAGDESWEEAKEGLDNALEELRKALDENAAETQPATQPTMPDAPAVPGAGK